MAFFGWYTVRPRADGDTGTRTHGLTGTRAHGHMGTRAYGHADIRTDGRTDGRTDRHTADGQTNRQREAGRVHGGRKGKRGREAGREAGWEREREREIERKTLSLRIHDSLHIFLLREIFYFPWNRYEIECNFCCVYYTTVNTHRHRCYCHIALIFATAPTAVSTCSLECE